MKHRSYKYLLASILFAIAIGISACSAPGAGSPSPTGPTNSESASEIADLKAENSRFKNENQQLNQQLQDIHSLVTSPSYTNAISKLTEIQSGGSDLAGFVYGLPDLPTLPLGLTVAQINNAIEQATALRRVLKNLPAPPLPIGPWQDLHNQKNEFIAMTNWMDNLQDLPDFLAKAESSEDLQANIAIYLRDTANTASDAKSMLGACPSNSFK